MAKSVAKYKGFYVGRYEMSKAGESKKGEISQGNDEMNWYGLYAKAKDYGLGKSNVTSEMIWGCQYDAMMNWMQGNGIDVKSATPTDTGRTGIGGGTTSRNTNNERKTGEESNDRLNNIFDLLGNRVEWTREARNNNFRVRRGGDYHYNYTPSERTFDFEPGHTAPAANAGSRLSLYVK